jgi:hypothetical protein
MCNQNDFYVYFHLMEDTDEIFYVGKGRGKRAFSKHGRNPYWVNVVNKHGLKVVIVNEGLTNDVALELEKYLIKDFGRISNGGVLVNMTDGGDGVVGSIPWNKGKKMVDTWNKGRVLSQETKDKISKSKKDVKRSTPIWNKGISLPDEIKEKMKGRVPWNKGLKSSDESREKMSNSAKKRNVNPFQGKKHSDETKKKISDSKKANNSISKLNKIIICINTGVIYKSQKEASDELGLSKSSISRVCLNQRKSTKGMIFMFYDDYLKMLDIDN